MMVRVSKKGGLVSIVDMISSEDPILYENYYLYERLRDPSHTYALQKSLILSMFTENHLQIKECSEIQVEVNVDNWLNLTRTEERIRDYVYKAIRSEVFDGGTATGLSPFYFDGLAMFKQNWIKIIAIK